jgi:hypothetical protein
LLHLCLARTNQKNMSSDYLASLVRGKTSCSTAMSFSEVAWIIGAAAIVVGGVLMMMGAVAVVVEVAS